MQGRVRKRGKGSWELTIDLGRDAEGKRQRKFVTVRGKRADADRRLREVMASLDKGLPLDTSKITVGEYLQRWYRDYVIPHTRPRTAYRYEGDIRLHITPDIGHVQLAQLRAADVQKLEAKLLADGKTARSVRHVHVVLREALQHGMRWGLTHVNVADAVTPPRVERKEVQVPSVDEVRRTLALAQETPYGTALTFMARTGVRRGECLGLRWADINMDTGNASIVQSLQRVIGRGLVFMPPKTAKSRRAIALDSETVNMLRELRGHQILIKAELGTVYHDNGLVFPGPFGSPLDPNALTRAFTKLSRKVGLRRVRLHDLRHFHATLLLEAGTHLKVVQERLGHSSIAITADIYSHVAPVLQREAADKFAEAMDAVP